MSIPRLIVNAVSSTNQIETPKGVAALLAA
jgi:hypothetical protein